MLKAAIEEKFTNNIFQFVQKTALGERERKQKRIPITKLFVLHANAVMSPFPFVFLSNFFRTYRWE